MNSYIKYGTICRHRDFIEADRESGAYVCTGMCGQLLTMSMQPMIYLATAVGSKWVKKDTYDQSCEVQVDQLMGN